MFRSRRFVSVVKSSLAAQLASRTIGMNSTQTDELFNDPGKLLQLIVAAEGTKGIWRRFGRGNRRRGKRLRYGLRKWFWCRLRWRQALRSLQDRLARFRLRVGADAPITAHVG